jgi:hypothetical protein
MSPFSFQSVFNPFEWSLFSTTLSPATTLPGAGASRSWGAEVLRYRQPTVAAEVVAVEVEADADWGQQLATCEAEGMEERRQAAAVVEESATRLREVERRRLEAAREDMAGYMGCEEVCRRRKGGKQPRFWPKIRNGWMASSANNGLLVSLSVMEQEQRLLMC